ncbi:coiled-coil domain-containing protein [[Ruminococcus] torques]
MATDVGIRVGVDGAAEFKNALKGIDAQLKNLDSEMKSTVSGLDSLEDAQAAVGKRTEILGKQISVTEQKISTISAEYDRSAKKLAELGKALDDVKNAENSTEKEITAAANAYNRQQQEVNRLGMQLNNATSSLNKLQREMRDVENGTDKVTRSFQKVENEAEDMGGSLRDAFVGGAVAGGIQSLASSLSGLVDETMEYRKIMASLNTSSAKAGYTAEQTAASYQRLYGVLGDEQTAATALANLQALGLSQADLTKLTDAAIGAWATYGDSIPIDGLAESINETIRAGAVTGTFADVLNWAGTSEDKFNEKLAKCKTESERVNLVMQELAKQGLADTAQAWRENNQDIVKTNQASAKMTETWAQLAKKASPVFAEIKTSIADAALGVMEFAEQNKGLVATAGAVVGAAAGFSAVTAAVKKTTETLEVFGFKLSASPIFLLAGVITGAAVAIGVLDKAAENADPEMAALRDRTEELTSSADALTSSWQTMTDASKQQAENRIAEIDQAQQLANELKGLVDANGKVAASDQERAAGIYEIVNDLMPGLVKKTGEGKKANYEFAKSIDAVIEKEKALALVEAYKDDYAEAVKTKAEAQKNLSDALAQQYDLEIKIQQAQAAGDYNKVADLQEQRAAIKETIKEQSELITSTENVTKSYEAMTSAIASGDYDKALTAAQSFGVDLADISQMSAQQIQAAYGDINNAIKTVENYLNSGSLTEAQRAQFTGILNELTVQKAQYEEQMAQTAIGGAKSFADSLSYEKSAIEGATKLVADASVAAMDIAQTAMEKGHAGGQEYAAGIPLAVSIAETNARILAQAAINAAAAKKAGMETTGYDLGAGLAAGLINSTKLVVTAANQVAQAAMNKMRAAENFNEHSPSKWGEETGEFVDEGLANGLVGGIGMVTAAVDKLSKVSKKTIKNNFDDITSTVLNAADILNDKLISKEEELTRRLEEVGLDDATKESLNAQLTAVKEFRTEYEKALQDIEKSQETMVNKLADYGELFTTVKEETGSFIELGDLQKDIDAINKYGDALEQLKTRGVSDSLLDEITGLSVDDALAYTDQLLNMTEEQYANYMSLWEEKQKAADEVARKFYQDEMDALTEEFVDKIPEELSDVKDEMRTIGVQGVQGMIDGLYSMTGPLAAAAKSVVAQAISAMRMEADIHSPSKKTKNLVGIPMGEGVVVGFDTVMKTASKDVAAAISYPFDRVTKNDLYNAAASTVNGMAAAGSATPAMQTIVIPVNLNGKQVAEVIYDPLKQVGKQRGY